MDIVVQDPNFSVVVPGGCNANCDFCFWEEKDSLSIIKFNKRLEYISDLLPDQFYQVSVTGGEPTLCSGITKTLKILRDRFEKVVFTTNGVGLTPAMVEGTVNHVNISRHHWDEDINRQIFGARGLPLADDLKSLCSEMNQVGIDVTFHSVLTEHIQSKSDILKYIQFARDNGASGVSFRKKHGPNSTNKPGKLEKIFSKYKEIYFSECPVCRSKTQLINGISVNWKSSTLEPSKGLNGIYELILNADGILTSDWEAQQVVELNNDEDDVILSIRRRGQEPKTQRKRKNEQGVELQVSPLVEGLNSAEIEALRLAQDARMLMEEEEIRRPRRGFDPVPNQQSACGGRTIYSSCG